MPLIHREETQDLIAGIWQVTEPDSFFQEKLSLYPAELEELSYLKNRKRTEWLSSRYLLHILSGRESRAACLKDEFGKPYLEGSTWYISMSHSEEMVAVAASPHPVGVDIQILVPKIYRIAPRFLDSTELDFCKGDHALEIMHILWGAKECVFKAFGKKEVDFRRHIHIAPFEYRSRKLCFQGTFHKESLSMEFVFFSETLKNFIFVYGYSI
jgi:phosphopantetheinyl transferase